MEAIIATIGLTLLLLAGCLWIAAVDFRERRIPDLASLLLLTVGLAGTGFVTQVPLADRLLGAGLGFLSLWAIGEAHFRLRGHEGLGIGDAKLFGAAGAWLGWAQLPYVLLMAAIMGLVYAAIVPGARDRLAFGPWLAAGLMLCWMRLALF